jgi:hypothetical protein
LFALVEEVEDSDFDEDILLLTFFLDEEEEADEEELAGIFDLLRRSSRLFSSSSPSPSSTDRSYSYDDLEDARTQRMSFVLLPASSSSLRYE